MRPLAPTLIQCKHQQNLHAEDLPKGYGCMCCGQPKRDGTPYAVSPALCISCLMSRT